MAAKVKAFADAHIDHMQIDRDAAHPGRRGRRGWRDLGVYKLTIPRNSAASGFGQQQYLKTMEILGGHDASVAVFVNAHHSIGVPGARAVRHARSSRRSGCRGLFDGSKLCAFALTEPEAGSDAGNVQTTATPTEDGTAYILNGTKHYITNGGIAHILTVMARTPDPDKPKGEGHGVPRHARHARLRGDRGARAEVRHPRHRDRQDAVHRTCGCRRRTSSGSSAAGCRRR